MENTEIITFKELNLENPIFIEALPGVGHVGKLVADHIIDELGATKFAEIYSPTFPPQVIVKNDGVIENMINELYYLENVGEDNLNLIFLIGNTQALSPEGQFFVSRDIFDYVEKLGIIKVITLGGIVTSPQPVDNPAVFGAATSIENGEVLKELDIELRDNDGGIVGASGLFLGLGLKKGIDGFSILGETPGYFVDAKSAEEVLKKLAAMLNFEISTDKLEERAEETKEMIAKAQQMEQDLINKANSGNPDDLRYIG